MKTDTQYDLFWNKVKIIPQHKHIWVTKSMLRFGEICKICKEENYIKYKRSKW